MEIDGKTKIYGIIGKPVTHSLSPAMHNSAFAHLGMNCAYLPLPSDDIGRAMQGVRHLGIGGASVTIPYKEQVIEHLDEVAPVAQKIGAVNTVLVQGSGAGQRLIGSNTDWQGANRALQEVTELGGRKVLVVGGGGAARAIGFGLLEAGAQISLCSRTETTGRSLAGQLGCSWYPIDDAQLPTADILINATSVGMTPGVEARVVPQLDLAAFAVVMDIVYSPLQTRLLKEAEESGCRCINGLEMLLFQGVIQFETWTGLPAPVAVMRNALLEAVTQEQGNR
jgi:shikimate dehydrogenase